MPQVILRLPAMLTVGECRLITRGSNKRFQLYSVDRRGNLDKWIALVDCRSHNRHQFYPAYYPANLTLKLRVGRYCVIAGERHVKFHFFRVTHDGAVEMIENPQLFKQSSSDV